MAAAAVVAGDASRKPLHSADISPLFRYRQADPYQDRGFQDRRGGVSPHKPRTWAAAHKVAGDTEELALSAKHQTVLASTCVPIHLS